MSGIVCSGNFRYAYVDSDGVLTGGYIGIVNTTKLTFTVPQPKTVQRISMQNETFGQALDTIFLPAPLDLEFATDDTGDAEIMSWALGGTPAAFTQTGGSITAEVHTAAKDQWIQLLNRSVSAVVVTDSTGTTTYTVNTDYLVDPAAGFIKITAGGTITDASSIKVNYTAAALTGQKVAVGNRSTLQLRIEGDAINLATGKAVHVVVPLAKLAPTGGLDLMGSNFLVTDLKGNALVLAGQPPASITLIA